MRNFEKLEKSLVLEICSKLLATTLFFSFIKFEVIKKRTEKTIKKVTKKIGLNF